jgi:hypothetical protein
LTGPALLGITGQHFFRERAVQVSLNHFFLRFLRFLPLVLAAALVPTGGVWATSEEDTVIRVIREATRQYETGDYTGAASNLDYAAQLVRQQKSEHMKSLLPEPLPGWQGQAPDGQALGSAIIGGGVTVSRDYLKGESTVSIEIVSDSPVLQSLLMMVNNPMFAGAGGGKLEMLKGQRAIIKYDEEKKDGEMYVVVDSRVVVTIKGSRIERRDLLAYGEVIDYQRLEKN